MSDSVLIVEDHRATLLGLRSLIQASDQFETVAAVDNGRDALLEAQKARPDLVCLDLGLAGDLDGFSVCAQLRGENPDVKVVVYTGHEELGIVARAREAGALGIVAKSEAYRELVRAFTLASNGQPYTSPRFARAALSPDLSARQREVLSLIAEGLDNTAVAERLDLAPETVKSHVKVILRKLEANHRTQAVAIGLRYMIID